MRQILSHYRFDILHVQTPHHPLMAQRLILAANKRTAVIGTFHIAAYSRLVTAGNWLLGWWLRPSLRRFDQVVSVSPAAAAFAKQTFHIDTKILPNVIDYPLFHKAQPLPRYNDNILTILFLGRLVPRKGCLLLLQAVAQLTCASNLPPFRVVICGKGQQTEQLQRFIKDHQLENIVEMVGFVSEAEKPRYYASADVSVFPSSGGESFGIVLLEAMASGRAAVLAGDNPGYRSVLSPQPELLFNPHDVQHLATLLKTHLLDQKLRDKAAEWGASYTRSFDVSNVGKQLEAIYREALRKRQSQ